MFYEELKHIIRSVLEQGLGGQSLLEVLTANINPTEIYASDDMLVTDSYFSLLHYAIGELKEEHLFYDSYIKDYEEGIAEIAFVHRLRNSLAHSGSRSGKGTARNESNDPSSPLNMKRRNRKASKIHHD